MKAHPEEPFPPGKGHVVLAFPGTIADCKGYHEPGAWLSPAPGTFGVAVLPQVESKQRMDGLAIVTENPVWIARWEATAPCQYKLTLDVKQDGVTFRLQSAGPAGGPIRSLQPDQGFLRVNGDWALSPASGPKTGGDGDWLWAELPAPPGRSVFEIRRLSPVVPPAYRTTFLPDMNLPDPRFGESLRAQVAHLLMGLNGSETRPGEGVNYPLTWLRDGSYALVALATSGQLSAARAVAMRFAERDFFGGFGPEADAPGLALWALEETSARLKDSTFDKEIWPHVHRKAEYILRMRRTTEPIREVVQGPIVPKHLHDANLNLVCEPARDGLIIGRMDHHRPLLFVNAVSYRGLVAAAEIATRVGAQSDANRWKRDADELQNAWLRTLDTPERDNERAATTGLWPTWVAATARDKFRAALEAQWAKARTPDGGFAKTPEWTYFDLAQAHNWLYLGDSRKAWQTLDWYLKNQASPGLYSWWEGSGEENSFGLWDNVRGWVQPKHVTPHYWTASEMLLLQYEMLAYATPAGELVIGDGIPVQWTRENLDVRNVFTRLGRVDWFLRDGKVEVTLDGKPVTQFRLGPALRNPSRSLRGQP